MGSVLGQAALEPSSTDGEEEGGGWNKASLQKNLKSTCKSHTYERSQGRLSVYMISLVAWFLGKKKSAE